MINFLIDAKMYDEFDYKIKVPILLDTSVNSLLINGAPGAGKSYLILLILAHYIKQNPQAKIFLNDFKGDKRDYGFLKEFTSRIALIDCCNENFNRYYDSFQNTKSNKENSRIPHLLIFDEYSAFVSSLESKEASIHKKKFQTLITQARAYNYSIIIGLQRSDSTSFIGGSRDSFQQRIGLGGVTTEGAKMLYDEFYKQSTPSIRGRGYLYRFGFTELKPIIVPNYNTELVKKFIYNHMLKNQI